MSGYARHGARIHSRLVCAWLAVALLLAGCGGSRDDVSFPSEEIRLLVPYAAGGPADLAARAYGEFLERDLGQPVVVENLPGGSGALATQELIQAEPDGHTLSVITAGTTVLTPLVNDVGYTAADVTPVGVLSEVPSLLAVGRNSPYTDVAAFVADARARQGAVTVGVPGASTPQAVELQRLRDEHGVTVTAVPFNGNAEMTTALLGGNVDAVLINASPDVTANLDAGEFRPLAVSTEQPLDWLPGTPTLAQAGFDGLTLSGSTFGLAGPAGLPEPVVGRLEDALRKAHADPEVVAAVGERYLGTQFRGAAEMRAVLDRTLAVYEPILGGS
ncbi:tripartite tricarboxylate transporter substrate binding protein [Pseudonocardia sp. DSM 110487]|uniref:tripartite tricarboxylate transporter substrate binding protein n=1 Tax=Pseudonocardia sp. DSM 110487 TaxID=2865833 RepID=UPI001C6A6A33|nr:tripartite tricarboxylate transporter substrate binding protein [Pseudonocardia sp. DSM 110487]QYN36040.1 tripartite tricarboxylate transporter substrate binding protein [Pseudonocardia sp. DSM 110487]